MNLISKILLVILLFSVVNAASSADSSAEEPQHVKDLRTYVGSISSRAQLGAIPLRFDASDALDAIRDTMAGGGVDDAGVMHVSEKLTYGKSFITKNAAPVDFIVRLLTGRNILCREAIEDLNIRIADVGCGLGLSAISTVTQVVNTYKAEYWSLESPIQFDLYDINPAHQPVLQALARIVNAAYPEYFHVTAACHDITSYLKLDYYDAILALNVMHYIPEIIWHLALANLESALKNSSYLLMTTDTVSKYVSANVRKKSVFFTSRFSFFPVGFTANDRTATAVFTDGSSDYLEKSYIPGETYTKDNVHVEKLVKMLSGLNYHKISLLVNGQRQDVQVNEIKDLFANNAIQIYAGNYSFDVASLTKAVEQKLKSTTKLQIVRLGWETYDECNTSISLQKAALQDTADSLSSIVSASIAESP